MAAGATHTPQVLKLSGIGPAKELRDHGIDVVLELSGAVSRSAPVLRWLARLERGARFSDELDSQRNAARV